MSQVPQIGWEAAVQRLQSELQRVDPNESPIQRGKRLKRTRDELQRLKAEFYDTHPEQAEFVRQWVRDDREARKQAELQRAKR